MQLHTVWSNKISFKMRKDLGMTWGKSNRMKVGMVSIGTQSE